MSNEQLIAASDRFHVFENAHGYRVARRADGAEATFYGDDECERFCQHFDDGCADESTAYRAEQANKAGEWAEREGEFGGITVHRSALRGTDPDAPDYLMSSECGTRDVSISMTGSAIIVDMEDGPRVWIEWQAGGWLVLCHRDDGDAVAKVVMPFDPTAPVSVLDADAL